MLGFANRPGASHLPPALPLLAQTADTAATTAYKSAMNSMMGAMMVPYSGNPDVDFIKGMVPHHQPARITTLSGKAPAFYFGGLSHEVQSR